MFLSILSDEAWERLLSYLKEWHQARLYLTGDTVVQRRVVCAPRSMLLLQTDSLFKDDLKPNVIYDVLLHTAVEVRVTQARLRQCPALGDAHACRRMRRLRTSHHGAEHLDLSALAGLTSLSLRGATTGPAAHLLPPNLTRLSMFTVCLYAPYDLTALSSLLSLKVGISPETALHLTWPSTLTDLKLNVRPDLSVRSTVESTERWVSRLPSGLCRLALVHAARHSPPVFDVMPPAQCAHLESYRVTFCRLSNDRFASFPPSMRQLDVGRMYHSGDMDVFCAALLRSSIDDLYVGCIRTVGAGLDESATNLALWRRTLMDMMPRLVYESVQGMISALSHLAPSVLDDTMVDKCVEALGRFGLSRADFQVMHCMAVGDFASLARATSFSADSPRMKRYIRRRLDDMPYAMFGVAPTAETLWGIRFGLYSSVYASHLETVTAGGVSASMDNVRVLVLDERAKSPLDQLLGQYDFSRIERIRVGVASRVFVQALHKNLSNFSSLQSLVFMLDVQFDQCTPEDVDLLRSMRFYPGNSPTCYQFRVSPPTVAVK